jgi:hypothetical protein
MRLTRTFAAVLAALVCAAVACGTGDQPISGSAGPSAAAISSTLTDEEAKALVYGFCSSGPSVRQGKCVSCVAKALNSLRSTGQIDGAQRDRLQSWFAQTGCAVEATARAVLASASAGGTVSLPNGPSVQVPANALAADTLITIRQSTAQPPSGALSAIYSFGPDGTTFTTPVTVTFPVPPGTVAASIYWTLPGSTTEYASLPTTIVGTTASAQVTHFSDGYVGALYIAGTWTGAQDYVLTTINGSVFKGTARVARDITQYNGNSISYRAVGSTGYIGTCNGTISGGSVTATVSDSCEITSLDGACRIHNPIRIDTIDNQTFPMTMTTIWDGLYTDAPGRSCSLAGASIHIEGSFTRGGAPPEVPGRWVGWLYMEPLVLPQALVEVRTQTGSAITSEATLPYYPEDCGAGPLGCVTFRCLGPLIDSTIYSHCEGTMGSCKFTSDDVTIALDRPWSGSISATWTFTGACSNYPGPSVPSNGSETPCPADGDICPGWDDAAGGFTAICTDLATDPMHCGDCGTYCAYGLQCFAALHPLDPCR